MSLFSTVTGCTWLYLDIPGCTWLYLALPGCTWLYLALPDCSRLYLILAFIEKSFTPLSCPISREIPMRLDRHFMKRELLEMESWNEVILDTFWMSCCQKRQCCFRWKRKMPSLIIIKHFKAGTGRDQSKFDWIYVIRLCLIFALHLLFTLIYWSSLALVTSLAIWSVEKEQLHN